MSKRTGSKETRRLAHEALRRKESRFARTFGGISDEELLNYLARCAKELGIGPCPTDVLGAEVLQQRFGSWDAALQRIGLERTAAEERKQVGSLFAREVEVWDELHPQILAEMRRSEAEFARQHSEDSDEEIFEYIRGWAKRLGHMPNDFEIVGGGYIRKRFKNDWCRVLHLAGLGGTPDSAPKPFKRLVYLDEVKRRMDIYVEECMLEIGRCVRKRRVIYVAPGDKTAV